MNNDQCILPPVPYQGERGRRGPRGIEGPHGALGPTGLGSVTGLTGLKGSIGSTGLSGFTGPMGATGKTGPKGYSGKQGATGLRGAIGRTGYTGATGMRGQVGSVGPRGPTGPTGARGFTGARGLTGMASYQLGPTGPTGATGSAGSNLLHGFTGVVAFTVSQLMTLTPDPGTAGLELQTNTYWLYVPPWEPLGSISAPDPNQQQLGTDNDIEYRYQVTTVSCHAIIALPYQVKKPQVWITPIDAIGYGFGIIDKEGATEIVQITVTVDGHYNVLIIGESKNSCD